MFFLPLKENTTSHICGDAVLTGASGLLGVFLPSPSTGESHRDAPAHAENSLLNNDNKKKHSGI